MIVSLIAALDRYRAIGRDNGLPWHPAGRSEASFKALTLGRPVLMGRKTAHSLWTSLRRENQSGTDAFWTHVPFSEMRAVDFA